MIEKKVFSVFLFILVVISVGCSSKESLEENKSTTTTQPTTLPSITNTAIIALHPISTSSPTEYELLEKRSQFLFKEPFSNISDFLIEIQTALKTNDKEALASLIYYPIHIYNLNGQDILIQSDKEFVADYEKILTPELKQIIFSQESTKLFMNWQGVMINRGEIWYSPICIDENCEHRQYYIITINHPSGRK